jgi:hypothetical protein
LRSHHRKNQSWEKQDLEDKVAHWEYKSQEDNLFSESYDAEEFVIKLGTIILDGMAPCKELDAKSVKSICDASNIAN